MSLLLQVRAGWIALWLGGFMAVAPVADAASKAERKEVQSPSGRRTQQMGDISFFEEAKKAGLEVATLAGGCFWGMEDLIRKMPGVLKTQVGYTGGESANPSYDDVKTGKTGHAESVQILFDPKKTTYEAILLEFFRLHDPTTKDRQGNDRGSQYRSVIFTHSEEQKKVAEKVKKRVDDSGAWKKPAVTEVVAASPFWKGEGFHQKYLEKNPGGYTCHFRRKLEF